MNLCRHCRNRNAALHKASATVKPAHDKSLMEVHALRGENAGQKKRSGKLTRRLVEEL